MMRKSATRNTSDTSMIFGSERTSGFCKPRSALVKPWRCISASVAAASATASILPVQFIEPPSISSAGTIIGSSVMNASSVTYATNAAIR
jgi:hypothetical protein